MVTERGTLEVVSCYGYSISERCKNLIVTLGDATFGDDMHVSDPITDVLIMLEGGVQSFAQAVNVLTVPGTKVYVFLNIRDAIISSKPRRFSASAFFHNLSRGLVLDLDTYLESVEQLNETQLRMASTAWAKFVSNNIKNRLGDITFYKVQQTTDFDIPSI
jgi:hypothetical protein